MKNIDIYRKKPKQARSGDTIGVIFEAAARILQTDGLDAFNTNAVARLAGVSIGTLYQYFPNKKAILIAIAQRELEDVSQKIIEKINLNAVSDDVTLARSVVDALLKAFGGRQLMRKVLIEALIANGLSDALTRPIENVIQTIIARDIQSFEGQTSVTLYVMTRALIGTIRSAVMEQSAHLGTAAFQDELVELMLYFMQARNRRLLSVEC